MGTPFISEAVVHQRLGNLERQATESRRGAALIAQHLADVRMFSACGKKELRAIAKTAKIADVLPGTQIVTEGDDGDTMYIVLVGTARVSRGGRKLATIGPGSTFGELALLSPGPRTATVVALSEMELAILTRKQLSKVLAAAPAFARKLLESLANTVRELDKKIV